MSTFYIPAPDNDDQRQALDHLIDSLQTLYPGLLTTSPAIAITTDVPQIAALFKSLAESAPTPPALPAPKPNTSKAARKRDDGSRNIAAPGDRPVRAAPGSELICRQCGEVIFDPDPKYHGFCTAHCKYLYYDKTRKHSRRKSPQPPISPAPALAPEPGVWREDPDEQGTVFKQLMAEAAPASRRKVAL